MKNEEWKYTHSLFFTFRFSFFITYMFNFWILGINARNLHYIGKHNPAKAVRLADDKIITKNFLTQRGIPVPTTYAVIKNRAELTQFDFFSLPHTTFIIKPARWSRGRGIFRVKKLKDYEPDQSLFLTSLSSPDRRTKLFWTHQSYDTQIDQHRFEVQGRVISESLLKTYCLDILDGKESLQGKPDHILIEELMLPGDWFETFCTHGLADIRIIVYNFVPVAAMLRVPTEASDGKANLDRWWVWLGVEVGTGRVQSMFLNGKVYTENFPDQYAGFYDQYLSYRDDILHRSTQIQYYVNLGYLALDRVITETWPKLLEINARAGLKIQLALDMPLRERLEKVGDLKVSSPEKGVEICQTLFSKLKTWFISPKRILPQNWFGTVGWIDTGEVIHHDVTIEIDLMKKWVYIDGSLAEKIWTTEKVQLTYDTEQIKLDISWRKKAKELVSYHVLLGGDVVSKYLIKPVHLLTKKRDIFSPSMILSDEYETLRLLDNKLSQINSTLIFSRYFKPTNFLAELDAFVVREGKYNPVFQYQRPKKSKLDKIRDDLERIREEFRDEITLESPLLALFEEKLVELTIKQRLLAAYREQDFELIDSLQPLYRWVYDEDLYLKAQEILNSPPPDRTVLWPVLGRKRIKKFALSYLAELWWEDIQIRFTPESYARMSVEKQWSELILNIASGTTFRKIELYATLAHELSHIRRYANAAQSPWNILRRWTAHSFVDEEWLAVLAAEQELPDSYEKRSMWQKYVRIHHARTMNFAQLAELFQQQEGNKSLLSIFKTIYRLKRGIQQTQSMHPWTASLQDTIYVQWYDRIRTWQANWGNIEDLMKGKIKIEDLPYFSS